MLLQNGFVTVLCVLWGWLSGATAVAAARDFSHRSECNFGTWVLLQSTRIGIRCVPCNLGAREGDCEMSVALRTVGLDAPYPK